MHFVLAFFLLHGTTALRLTFKPASRAPIGCAARTRRILAQWETLLPGWAAHQDEQGQVYYCNEQSGQCQWEAPLPSGWVAHQDEQGQVYYCNEQSGQCQWEMPQEQYGQQDETGYMEQGDSEYAQALEDVALAEERLKQSVEHSPCNGPSMEALEALEAADERLAANGRFAAAAKQWLAKKGY